MRSSLHARFRFLIDAEVRAIARQTSRTRSFSVAANLCKRARFNTWCCSTRALCACDKSHKQRRTAMRERAEPLQRSAACRLSCHCLLTTRYRRNEVANHRRLQSAGCPERQRRSLGPARTMSPAMQAESSTAKEASLQRFQSVEGAPVQPSFEVCGSKSRYGIVISVADCANSSQNFSSSNRSLRRHLKRHSVISTNSTDKSTIR